MLQLCLLPTSYWVVLRPQSLYGADHLSVACVSRQSFLFTAVCHELHGPWWEGLVALSMRHSALFPCVLYAWTALPTSLVLSAPQCDNPWDVSHHPQVRYSFSMSHTAPEPLHHCPRCLPRVLLVSTCISSSPNE